MLNDYEEGDRTPSYNALTTGSITTNFAKYVKVGGLVHVQFYVGISSTSTNVFQMDLPFTNTGTDSWCPMTVQTNASVDPIIGRVRANETLLEIKTMCGDVAYAYTNFNSKWIIGGGTFKTND